MKVSYENSIKTLESQLKEEQTALAGATKSMTENQQQSAESNGQHIELNTEYHEHMEECCDTKNEFMSEICALEKIRGELYRMENIEMFITDCEVAAWIDEECSVSCGGGEQQRTRSIIVHPANGTACPALQMERSCSMQGCPVDCKVDQWSQWSECTAECGGGVMQRVRSRTQEPDNDGDPCPEMSESKECNVDACNANCVLQDWTDWGICSKACDNGHESRVRRVSEEARGNGICPHPENEFRMDHRICNEFDCALLVPQDGSNRTHLECAAMIDIVLMVDGSGSLEEYGWQEFKGTIQKVVNAMVGNVTGVNVAVMLFSGPDNGPDLEDCTSADPKVQPDIENQCGIKWVSPFSTNIEEVEAKVAQMVWPAKTTLTSMAIAEAKAMLVNGRPEASSLVVILTDGKPMSPIKTGQACDDIKQEARLVWIPTGGGVKDAIESMKLWASKPSQDNVLQIDTFATLGTDATLNNIISTICPAVQ